MLAPKSTHKRKRSSARSDNARKLGRARWIVNLLPSHPHSHRAPPDSHADGSVPSPSNVSPWRSAHLNRLVHAHPFNRSLELILPLAADASDASFDSSAPLPASVQSLVQRLDSLASSHKSYRARIPISMLLDPIFVTAYLKTGSLIALCDPFGAPGLSADLQDTACVDGQGTLVLSLCKDTYHTLGLSGRASHFSRLASGRAADRTSGPDSRFIVELPLLSPSFVPGKKGYQQALDRLRAWDRSRAQALATELTIAQSHASSKFPSSSQANAPVTNEHATWSMLFVWSHNRATAESILASASSSGSVNEIRFPEHLVRPEDVETLTLQAAHRIVTDSIWVPTLGALTQNPLVDSWHETERHFSELEPLNHSANPTWPAFQDGLQVAVEWAGLASLGASPVRTYTRPDATCVYSSPSNSRPGRTVKLSWSGSVEKPLLLSPLLISHMAAEVDRALAEAAKSCCASNVEKAEWATLSCSGFPHAPLTWRSKVPLSSIYGAKELPGNKATSQNKSCDAVQDVAMPDASSTEDEDGDGDSDSSLDMGELRAPRRTTKKRSKRNVNKNHTEHTFTPSTGETGWISFCLGASKPAQSKSDSAPAQNSCRWVLVELIGTDTRS